MSQTHDPDELITLEIAAARHGVSVKTLYTRHRRGTLPAPDIRSGRFLFWRWSTLGGLTFRERPLGRPQAKDGGT